MRHVWRLPLVSTTLAAAAAILFSCVGDDPTSAGGSDAGNGNDGTTNPEAGDAGLDGMKSNVDDGGDAQARRCDPAKPFGDPQPLAWPINDGTKDENNFSMTSDELVAVVERAQDILYTSRASKADPFPAPSFDKVVSVSTGQYEGSPSLSGDGKNLYFVRLLAGGATTILVAHRESLVDSFDAPVTVTVDGVSADNADRVVVNRLANRMVFRIQDFDDTYIADRTAGSFMTFISKRSLGGPLEHPTFSGDDLTMYFVANDLSGASVMRYVTRSNAGGVFGAQIDMPANLKTGFEPLHVTDDHCIMYVRTAKGSDAGRYDIWEARRPN